MPEADQEECSPADSVGDYFPRLPVSAEAMAAERSSSLKGRVRFAETPDRLSEDDKANGKQSQHEKELRLQVHKLEAMERESERPQVNMVDLSKTPPSSRGSLFTNFEDVQLTDEERLYLNAAALGDVGIIRQSLEESEVILNVNCVDYMGRNALHLAVDSESMDASEMLLDRLNFECIEEALLHAISKGLTKLVKVIIEHPNYMAGDDQVKRSGVRDPFFRTEEKSQFSPDITPLILAAHYNSHEIIQMFLARNHVLEKPHPISCQCTDCVTKQNYDSLKRSRSRLNAYRALASPAYMALSSPEPIMTTFELRQEMKKLAQVEKEFKNEYLSLVEQCMDFACELMDLCRGTQEVEAVLSEGADENGQNRDPLARLKMAMEYEEKKFVAHPNCQQHLTSIWFGPEMGFMQSITLWKKILMWIVCVPLVPFFCLIYIISPDSKLANALRCPCAKFITHTLSHACFLILLAAATFRLDEKSYPISSTSEVLTARSFDAYEPGGDGSTPVSDEVKVDHILKATFRPANILMTNVQICLLFWVFGLMWMECKQLYNSGIRVYCLDNYNYMDYMVLSLYLSSYVLRFLVDHWIKQSDNKFDGGISRARDVLLARNFTQYEELKECIFNNRSFDKPYNYWMKASRFEWKADDPEIVSDVLFAIANVLSIARTTYLMPAFEVLGPLQISLGRMIADISRFLVLFSLVLFAFMVGLHNLYWYYGSQTYIIEDGDGNDKVAHSSEPFQGGSGGKHRVRRAAANSMTESDDVFGFVNLPRTFYSLFWSMFGLVTVDSVEIQYPNKNRDNKYANTHFPGGNHATSLVETVGMFLFGCYHVVIIIILVNMLIAMMSHSFEAIQGDCDVEWKFARTNLWMNYIDDGSTLPVPFNMIPTPKSARYAWRWLKDLIRGDQEGLLNYEMGKRQTFIKSKKDKKKSNEASFIPGLFFKKRRENVCQSLNIEAPETSYTDILQRLVRRYLFKLERHKDEDIQNDHQSSTVISAPTQFIDVGPPPEIAGQEKGGSTGMDLMSGATTEAYNSASREPTFADEGEGDEAPPPSYGQDSGYLAPPPPPGGDGGGGRPNMRRRMSLRPGSSLRPTRNRRPSVGQNQPQVQLLSIPQLDAIQRSLKLLDVRLQHVQSNAKEDERQKDDIDHIRRVMSENQKALSTVVTVLASIQEEVRSLSITIHQREKSTFQIQAPSRKKSAEKTNSNQDSGPSRGLASLETSHV